MRPSTTLSRQSIFSPASLLQAQYIHRSSLRVSTQSFTSSSSSSQAHRSSISHQIPRAHQPLLSVSSNNLTNSSRRRYQSTSAAMSTSTDITLYTVGTPNGIKASILLEELGLDYKVYPIRMSENEQKEQWFLDINPNGRIPALTDKFDDGKEINIWESGAILQYLVDRYDKEHKVSYPAGSREAWEVTCWLMWQMCGLGPMQGQANHFKRYAPEQIEYGINRYVNETRRLYRTMETALSKNPSGWLVGDRCTIADISCWGWVTSAKWAGVDMAEFPILDKWVFKCLERPGFEKGRNVPTKHTAFELRDQSEEELEKKAAASRGWVQAGMKADAKK